MRARAGMGIRDVNLYQNNSNHPKWQISPRPGLQRRYIRPPVWTMARYPPFRSAMAASAAPTARKRPQTQRAPSVPICKVPKKIARPAAGVPAPFFRAVVAQAINPVSGSAVVRKRWGGRRGRRVGPISRKVVSLCAKAGLRFWVYFDISNLCFFANLAHEHPKRQNLRSSRPGPVWSLWRRVELVLVAKAGYSPLGGPIWNRGHSKVSKTSE